MSAVALRQESLIDALDHIVIGRAVDVLDTDERIALGVATGSYTGHEIDVYARGGARVVGRVGAGAAVSRS
jgi:hypothetical protein